MPRPSQAFRTLAGAVLLGLLPLAVAHGHDGDSMDMSMDMTQPSVTRPTIPSSPSETNLPAPNYFTHGEHGSLMMAHIMLMTFAWVFVLPVGE